MTTRQSVTIPQWLLHDTQESFNGKRGKSQRGQQGPGLVGCFALGSSNSVALLVASQRSPVMSSITAKSTTGSSWSWAPFASITQGITAAFASMSSSSRGPPSGSSANPPGYVDNEDQYGRSTARAGGFASYADQRGYPQQQQPQQQGAQSETEEDLEDSEVLMPSGSKLNKKDITIFCSSCRHNTIFDDEENLVECAACHRVYHQTCYDRHVSRTEGISLPDPQDWEDGVPWFHSQACKKVYDHLGSMLASGEQPVSASPGSSSSIQQQQSSGAVSWPGSGSQGSSPNNGSQEQQGPRYSWRVVECGIQGASPASRIAMTQVYNILSRDFGYTMKDYAQFDLAAVLRRDGQPAAAAVLDVYGPDVAELFVMATRRDLRRQGHCRMLIQQLSNTLATAGVRRMVVSIDQDDETAMEVWNKLGFEPLKETTLRQLSWSIPAFGKDATEGTIYMGQELKQQKRGFLG